MFTCSVANCKISASDVGIRFFKIPEDYNDAWKKVINRTDWTPRKTSKICSLHFSKDSIKGNKLIPGTTPKEIGHAFVHTGNRSGRYILHLYVLINFKTLNQILLTNIYYL